MSEQSGAGLATRDVEVRDDPDERRYEITVDGERAGVAVYQLRGGRRWFVHTEVDPAFEGQGLGSRLAHDALELARVSGEPIVNLCPFIAAYVDRHAEFADLVDRDMAGRLGD